MDCAPAHLVHTDEDALVESTGSSEETGSIELGSRSSAGERLLHTQDVTGSIPVATTTSPAVVQRYNWSDPERYQGFTAPYNFTAAGWRAKSHIYCIRSGEFLKVGMTEDLTRRLLEFQAGNPHDIFVEARRTVPRPLARQIERRLHTLFADRSIGREWFRDLTSKEVTKAAAPILRAADLAMHRWTLDGFSAGEPYRHP